MINLIEELNNPRYWIDTISEIKNKDKPIPGNLDVHTLILNLAKHGWTPPHLVRVPKSDGKSLRDIYIFNDLDSLIMKVINKILFTKFKSEISESVYSYIKGKRTFHAAKYIQSMIKDKNLYGVKIDLSNFFLGVTQESIVQVLTELVSDYDGFNLMFRLFNINSYTYKNEMNEMFLSMMPGAAISSFFANYILKDVDDYISKNTEVYSRYSDDLIFFCNSQKELNEVVDNTKDLVAKLGLSLNPKKTEYLDSSQTIEYLGLKITEDKIDVSDKFMKSLKSKIKSICKKERKYYEMNKASFPDLQRTCGIINRFLYGEIFINALQHSSTRISYAFSNVDNWESFQKLDYYIADQLRFLMNGKHNKTLYHSLSMDKLSYFGFQPLVKMYHLFKVDKDIYMNKVSTLLGNSNLERAFVYTSKLEISEYYSEVVYNNFSELYKDLLKNRKNKIVIEGSLVNPEYLIFDIPRKVIKFRETIIAENGSLTVDKITCILDGKHLEILFKSKTLASEFIGKETLMWLYLDSQVTLDLNRQRYNYNLFRKYKMMDLINDFGEECFRLYESIDVKIAEFMSIMYFYLNCKENINPRELQFIKISKDDYHLVIEKSWVSK